MMLTRIKKLRCIQSVYRSQNTPRKSHNLKGRPGNPGNPEGKWFLLNEKLGSYPSKHPHGIRLVEMLAFCPFLWSQNVEFWQSPWNGRVGAVDSSGVFWLLLYHCFDSQVTIRAREREREREIGERERPGARAPFVLVATYDGMWQPIHFYS